MGGYVYERAYLSFRFAPPDDISGSEIQNYNEEMIEPLEEAMEYFVEPDLADMQCYVYAMELFYQYQRYGFPHGGGPMDQDSLYMYMLECVMTAKERSDREKRADQAKMDAANQQNAQSQGSAGAYGTSDLG